MKKNRNLLKFKKGTAKEKRIKKKKQDGIIDHRIEYKEGSKDIKLVNIKALLNSKVLLDKLNKKKENTTTTLLCFYSFYLWNIIGKRK